MSGLQRGARVRRADAILLGIAIIGILASAAFAEFGERWWLFDVFAHFRWHYIATALILVPLALWRRRRWLALAALLAGAAHVPAVIERPAQIAQASPGGPIELSVMTANVWWRSDKLDNLMGRIKVADPDIVVLQEVYGPWHRAVETLRVHYPHIAPAAWRESGIVILSRHPILASRADEFTATADVDFKGRTLRVAGVHMPTPLSAARWHAQQATFDRLAADARAAGMPFIAAGDFNLTPYSPRFGAFLDASGLRRAPLGGFWPATWPAASGLKYGGPFWRGFEIDHILVSREFGLANVFRGPDIGSDHFPVHALLKFLR